MAKRLISSLLLAVCCACRAMEERRVGPVVIRAYSPVLADRTAVAVAKHLPRFSVPHEHPVELVVTRGASGMLGGVARVDEAELEFDPIYADASRPAGAEFDHVVVHELMHLYIRPDERLRLPPLLEEGLAEVRTFELIPETRAWGRARHAMILLSSLGVSRLPFRIELTSAGGSGRVPAPFPIRAPRAMRVTEAFDVTRIGFSARPDDETWWLTALGWFLVERVGEDTLAVLIERAKRERIATVPAAWVFEVASLNPDDPASWVPFIEAMLGEGERRMLERWPNAAAESGAPP